MKPNNVTRMLDAKGIPYQAHELPAEKLGALEAAQVLGVPPDQVYKTIVITREGQGKPVLAARRRQSPGSRPEVFRLWHCLTADLALSWTHPPNRMARFSSQAGSAE